MTDPDRWDWIAYHARKLAARADLIAAAATFHRERKPLPEDGEAYQLAVTYLQRVAADLDTVQSLLIEQKPPTAKPGATAPPTPQRQRKKAQPRKTARSTGEKAQQAAETPNS